MSAPAANFPISKGGQREEAINKKVRPRQDSDLSHGVDNMTKAEEAEMREAVYALCLSGTAVNKALLHITENGAKPGSANRNTIIAALLIAFVPQVFSVVWWTRGNERDVASDVKTL